MRGSVKAVRDWSPGEPAPRVIRRYTNRKLYDTHSSQYVTLPQLAKMVREGESIRIIDNTTQEDKTQLTLALIISKELELSPGGIPLQALRALLRHDSTPPSSGVQATEAEYRVGLTSWIAPRSFPARAEEEDGMGDASETRRGRSRLEEWQAAGDARANPPEDAVSVQELQGQVQRLDERLTALEQRLNRKKK